jgi:peroxiredoxin
MHSRLSPRATVALCLFAAFSLWINWRAKSLEFGVRGHGEASALIGKPAPGLALESLDGHPISLTDYRGKTLVVSFWASWCGPCRMEMPELAKFYRQEHKAGSDFDIIAISIDHDKADAAGAVEALNLPFPVAVDSDSRVANLYGVESIPMLFVVDKAGKITYSNVGFEMGTDFMLAQQLNIKNYSSADGEAK